MDKQSWLPFGLYGFKHKLRNACSVPGDKQPRNEAGWLMLPVDAGGAGRGPPAARMQGLLLGPPPAAADRCTAPRAPRVLGAQCGAGPARRARSAARGGGACEVCSSLWLVCRQAGSRICVGSSEVASVFFSTGVGHLGTDIKRYGASLVAQW